MAKLFVIFTLVSLSTSQTTNNGQNNVNCRMCGQANGGNVGSPQTQDVFTQLKKELPFLRDLNLGPSSAPVSLACPTSPFFFPTTRSEPRCTVQSDCTGANELCCFWGRENYCLKGLDTTPKSGVCPAQQRDARSSCKADFSGCRFDSQCSSTHKCCEVVGCGYSECSGSSVTDPPVTSPPVTIAPQPVICTLIACPPPPGPSCVNVGQTFPNGPRCGACRVCNDVANSPSTVAPQPSPQPVRCTRIGCPRPPGPSCVNVGQTFPNGPQCGACSVCIDVANPPSTVAPQPSPQPVPCTKIGCPRPPGPSCVNVGQTFPNGPQCGACRVCNDVAGPPTSAPPPAPSSGSLSQNLACPTSPFFFPTTRSEPQCTTQADCTGADVLCCFWSREANYCLKGIDTTPKQGVCPVQARVSSSRCKQDFSGCRFDSQCSSTTKCCETLGCGYKECAGPPTAGPPTAGPPTAGPPSQRMHPLPPVSPLTAPSMSCQTPQGLYMNAYDSCRMFTLTMTSHHSTSSRNTQPCAPGTLVDLATCTCNHMNMVNPVTCRSL